MIPITRKELYLNKIVGNNEYETPEKPISEEEFFFAEILGEAVQAPEPLTRYQMYLAKIAGHNIEIPYPEVRLEYFLARAAGMEIETPTPITREEMFWADYALIVEKELSGIPPFTFNAIAGTLKNYHIYGNTVNGESVGDRTANLFDNGITIENGSVNTETGADSSYQFQKRLRTSFIGFLSAGTYTINADGVNRVNCIALYSSQNSDDFIETVYGTAILPKSFTLNEGGYIRIAFSKTDNSDISPYDISNIMLNAGSEALSYEPYGYRVPVTVTNGMDTETTNIYLPEQIKMVGDEAEYVDYGQQKQHRVRKNLLKITYASSGATTYDGVFISNNDGILTLNGTSNNGAFVNLATAIKLPIGNYILTGGSENLMIRFQKTFSGYGYDDTGAGRNFICPEEVTSGVCMLKLTANYTYNSVKVYPMIRKADIEDDTYEPYIADTELDVTFPALPTLSGTNTLSVGTEVQPSGIEIKGRIQEVTP